MQLNYPKAINYYTVKLARPDSNNFNRVSATHWVRNMFRLQTIPAVKLVDDIYNGGEKVIEYVNESNLEPWVNCEFFKVTTEKIPTDIDRAQAEWEEQNQLLELACSGNAQAAIEFCKLYEAGKITLHVGGCG